MNSRLALAMTQDGKEITVKQCQQFLEKKNREALAAFIYDRLYGRHLKPTRRRGDGE